MLINDTENPQHSPTDLHQTEACSFCGTPAGKCRVLLHNETRDAFICDVCAPVAARQSGAVMARQEAKTHA